MISDRRQISITPKAVVILAGIVMMFASKTYYSITTDTLEEILLSDYRPIGYAQIILSFIPLLMLITKIFDRLGAKE